MSYLIVVIVVLYTDDPYSVNKRYIKSERAIQKQRHHRTYKIQYEDKQNKKLRRWARRLHQNKTWREINCKYCFISGYRFNQKS
jgi:hypothetical protein